MIRVTLIVKSPINKDRSQQPKVYLSKIEYSSVHSFLSNVEDFILPEYLPPWITQLGRDPQLCHIPAYLGRARANNEGIYIKFKGSKKSFNFGLIQINKADLPALVTDKRSHIRKLGNMLALTFKKESK